MYFFYHRAILPHLNPWLYALQTPRVSKSHLLSEDLLDNPWCWNQNSLFLIPTTSQDINYYCVILSLNLPTDLESGLLEGVNYQPMPSWCPSHLAFDCETKVISALTKVMFRPECLHILPLDCPPSPGIREDCHCPHFPDEESRLSESVSFVAKPQRQKG